MLVGLWARIRTIFGAKLNTALDRLENPAETLDYSYERQVSLLRDVKRGLAEIATAKQRLKLQAEKLRQRDADYQRQAQEAVRLGRDDLARLALERKQALAPQLQSLGQQVAQLDEQQAKLADASEKLQARITMFGTQKEAIKAQYQASRAQVKITESYTGLSREMGDIGASLQRAQDRVEQMQARSTALDELLESGALTDYTAQLGSGDDIDRQLQLAGANDEIEMQLAAMKAQLTAKNPPQLEAGE
jgi:phage shock protein A